MEFKVEALDLPGDITHHILIALDILVFHLSLGSRLRNWGKASGLIGQICSLLRKNDFDELWHQRENRGASICVDGLLIKSHLVISVRP